VLIVTPGVTTHSYMEPLIEGIHYIRVSNPSEIPYKLSDITKEKWEEMSIACYEWYQRNVYSTNCWSNMISNILYGSA